MCFLPMWRSPLHESLKEIAKREYPWHNVCLIHDSTMIYSDFGFTTESRSLPFAKILDVTWQKKQPPKRTKRMYREKKIFQRCVSASSTFASFWYKVRTSYISEQAKSITVHYGLSLLLSDNFRPFYSNSSGN